MESKFCLSWYMMAVSLSLFTPMATEFAVASSEKLPPITDHPCAAELTAFPVGIDAGPTFENLVNFIYDDLIVRRGAPGLVVGISGTDSIVAFLAAARAFERAGKPDRVAGIHFGPSEEFLDDHPEARPHLWFQETVIPWLRKKAPHATITVDTSFDWRQDGLRWGRIYDWSMVSDLETRLPRAPGQNYWVVGTRNATEEALCTYSNASMGASVQVLNHLWKSDILAISQHLGVPSVAVEKSCMADCACGRDRLAANHIPEVDAILRVQRGLLSPQYLTDNIPALLLAQLTSYVGMQQQSGAFKKVIPYVSPPTVSREKRGFDVRGYQNLKTAVLNGNASVKDVVSAVRSILSEEHASAASDLMNSALSKKGDEFAPESLLLFGARGLTSAQQQQMLQRYFSIPKSVRWNEKDVDTLVKINARLGFYGWSFAQWRFLTQRFGGGTSIVERFGMQALVRETDVRDGRLPTSNPQRDEWGKGFVWRKGDLSIEYRRAYILVAIHSENHPIAILIRNSSRYFGRDRLKYAVTISFQNWSEEELRSFTPTQINAGVGFLNWSQFFLSMPAKELSDKLSRVNRAVSELDHWNDQFDQWLLSSPALADFLEFQNQAAASDQSGTVRPIFLAHVARGNPSWLIQSSRRVTEMEIQLIRLGRLSQVWGTIDRPSRIVLVGNADGDGF